jgi:hypothetical protein
LLTVLWSSNLRCMDECCHILAWFSMTVSQFFSSELLSALSLWIKLLWYYALIITPCGRTLTWITPSGSQKTLVMMLPSDSSVLNFLSGGDPLWCHSMLDLFDPGVKLWTQVSSQITVCSRNVFPSD